MTDQTLPAEPKKRPAFQFYPGDWRGSRWVTLVVGEALFPRLPACYVIYIDGRLSYVGQAGDLAVRMSAHGLRTGYGGAVLSKWGQHRSVVVKARFSTLYGDWAMRELRLIRRLQPPLNCVGSVRRRGAA